MQKFVSSVSATNWQMGVLPEWVARPKLPAGLPIDECLRRGEERRTELATFDAEHGVGHEWDQMVKDATWQLGEDFAAHLDECTRWARTCVDPQEGYDAQWFRHRTYNRLVEHYRMYSVPASELTRSTRSLWANEKEQAERVTVVTNVGAVMVQNAFDFIRPTLRDIFLIALGNGSVSRAELNAQDAQRVLSVLPSPPADPFRFLRRFSSTELLAEEWWERWADRREEPMTEQLACAVDDALGDYYVRGLKALDALDRAGTPGTPWHTILVDHTRRTIQREIVSIDSQIQRASAQMSVSPNLPREGLT